MRPLCSGFLGKWSLLVLHALLGDQQNDGRNHQAAADHIEDGSADAAGGGQGNAAGFLLMMVVDRLPDRETWFTSCVAEMTISLSAQAL